MRIYVRIGPVAVQDRIEFGATKEKLKQFLILPQRKDN